MSTTAVERGLLGPREPERVWSRHVLHCAVLGQLVPSDDDLVDVGSGAGLPGIPLALARPDLTVRLVEPMGRRVQFLREVVDELGLAVEVIQGRAEEMAAEMATTVVARAVAPLERLLPMLVPLVRRPGRVLAMKGRTAEDELRRAEPLLRRRRDLRVRLDQAGQDEHTVRVVRVDVPATTKADER